MARSYQRDLDLKYSAARGMAWTLLLT